MSLLTSIIFPSFFLCVHPSNSKGLIETRDDMYVSTSRQKSNEMKEKDENREGEKNIYLPSTRFLLTGNESTSVENLYSDISYFELAVSLSLLIHVC